MLLLGYSREALALAQVRIFPRAFARISAKHGEPVNGVLLMTGLTLLAVAVGGGIAQVATLVVIAMLGLQIALGAAALRIPRRLPDLYRQAGFRLGPVALRVFGIGLILLSAGFLVIAAWGDVKIVMIAAAYLLLGAAYYGLRRVALSRDGVNVDDLIRAKVDAALTETT